MTFPIASNFLINLIGQLVKSLWLFVRSAPKFIVIKYSYCVIYFGAAVRSGRSFLLLNSFCFLFFLDILGILVFVLMCLLPYATST